MWITGLVIPSLSKSVFFTVIEKLSLSVNQLLTGLVTLSSNMQVLSIEPVIPSWSVTKMVTGLVITS